MPDISLEECPHCATQQVSAELVSQMEIDADPSSPKPESTEGGRLVSILKWPEGAPLNLG